MSWGTKLKLGGEIPKADGQEATEPGLKPDYGTAKPSLPLCISEPTPHPHHLSCCHLYLKWGQPTVRGSVPLSWTIPVIFTLLPFYLFISQKILMKAQFLPDTAFTWSTFQFNIDTAARVRAWIMSHSCSQTSRALAHGRGCWSGWKELGPGIRPSVGPVRQAQLGRGHSQAAEWE